MKLSKTTQNLIDKPEMHFIGLYDFEGNFVKFNFIAKSRAEAIVMFEEKYPHLAKYNDYEYE